tara:strand:- start:558 stop:1517 length:960 start_codon:yes stop_codon:yes gene_type:complete
MKRFKDMFEDAPVNATGVAVSTDKPIVRKKKRKKEDSEYREIGTPELLKRYMDDTPGQSMNESRKKDMTAISSWKKKLKNVKGLSKDVVQQLSTLPTPVVTSLINQIGMIVADNEPEHEPHVKDKEKEKKKVVLKGSLASVNEARLVTDGKLVTDVAGVLDVIAKKLKSEMGKRYKRNQKDGMNFINSLAKMVGMTASDKNQSKNRMFLRMGEEVDSCCDDCDNLFDHVITEAEYQGKKVKLNDPIRGGSKKFYVYVKNEKGNVVKVSFGDTTGLSIKRDDPKRRASFRARHNCDNPGPKWKARYWSCYQWRAGAKVNN